MQDEDNENRDLSSAENSLSGKTSERTEAKETDIQFLIFRYVICTRRTAAYFLLSAAGVPLGMMALLSSVIFTPLAIST